MIIFHILNVLDQRAEDHLEFKAREVGAEAEVLADPQTQDEDSDHVDNEPERFIEKPPRPGWQRG